jgi:signal transduction histidine kinase
MLQIEFFAHNHEVARLEELLPQSLGAAQCRIMLALAWYLRQQDVARALHLSLQLDAAMPIWLDLHEQAQCRVRMQLIRGEILFLQKQDKTVLPEVELALQQAQALQDPLLQADAYSLLGFIYGEIGDEGQRREQRRLACDCARAAGDVVRSQVAELALGFVDVLTRTPLQSWDHWLLVDHTGLHPAVQVALNNLIGIMPGRRQFSVRHFSESFAAAMRSGQMRAAIVAASNIADHLNELNEHEAALEWNSRALELARPSGWQGALALALLQTGETMRHLGRFDSAEELLLEGLQLVEGWPNSRNYAIGLLYLGELAIASGKPEAAFDYFTALQQRADHLQHLDFQALAERGRAHAKLLCGHPAQALQLALVAWQLALTAKDTKRQIDALMVLAQVHCGRDLPDPNVMPGATSTPALYYLQKAYELGSQIDGYNIDCDLYDALGNEYARLGCFDLAYEMARQGSIAREKTHTAQATQRAIALQIRYQTERTEAEGERDRQLADEKARHVALLQQTRNTLEHLDAIGQEITAQLELAAVFRVLDMHVHQLLEVNSFALYLLEGEARLLQRVFAMENRQRLPVIELSLDDPDSDCVRCLRLGQPLMMDWPPDNQAPNQEAGTLDTLSALYAPLVVGARVLGVMSVQSVTRHAFGEREQLIFHTLCSYGAIALDNAHAYKQLLQAQAQLVEQEKLAALGGLVAGVAHELNTPLGNCLMMASSLQQMGRDLQARLEAGSVQRSWLETCLDDSALEIGILERGLATSMNLVSSFQQVVVDRSSVQRRQFELHELCVGIEQRMGRQIQSAGHGLKLEIGPGWRFDSYPGPLGQVLELLIENALQHAFPDGRAGQISMQVQAAGPDRVRLQLLDNGIGIAPEQQKQVFEPFFTSKMGQGRCGLGLSIGYNIVNTLLNGQISVQSERGQGSCFILDLPLSVAES